MKPLGWKKTRTRVACHSDCAVCHPETKGGRAAENRKAREWTDAEVDAVIERFQRASIAGRAQSGVRYRNA